MNNKSVWIVTGGSDNGDVILGVYDTSEAAHSLAKHMEDNVTEDHYYVLDGVKYLNVIVRQYAVNL